MPSVIFVHGTGTRDPSLTDLYNNIRTQLTARRSNLTVSYVPWGTDEGYKLYAGGISIPTYTTTGGHATLGVDTQPQLTPAEYEVAIWGLLYQDPLAELRLLASSQQETSDAPPVQSSASQALDQRLQALATAPSDDLRRKLQEARLDGVFSDSVQQVQASESYRQVLLTTDDNGIPLVRAAIARAVTATAMAQLKGNGAAPLLFFDAAQRDSIVQLITDDLASGPGTLGITDVIMHGASLAVADAVTGPIRARRGELMDHVLGFIGDILVYQGHADEIRVYLRDKVLAAEPPVVLLAHSLGGIACVDLLVQESLQDRVPLLITAGSQAPVFYEMGALHTLKYAQDAVLPPTFPPWLNFYDYRDFLSFIGEQIFPGKVHDVAVDNRQPFPFSHSAYWTNADVFDRIVAAIDNPKGVVGPGHH